MMMDEDAKFMCEERFKHIQEGIRRTLTRRSPSPLPSPTHPLSLPLPCTLHPSHAGGESPSRLLKYNIRCYGR